MLLWVCDVEGSTKALNDRARVDGAERFIQRLYWMSTRLMRSTGAAVSKWTGDGFLAAYEVPLDRDLGAAALKAVEAAWHLTFLNNVTYFGLGPETKFRLRHGIAFEPDAIVINAGATPRDADVIGRGVVFATRLSGIPSPFPGVVVERRLAAAAQLDGCAHHFGRRRVNADEVLRYFKGERRGCSDVFEIVGSPRRRRTTRSAVKSLKRAIHSAEHGPPPAPWLDEFIQSMQAGPVWAQKVNEELFRFVGRELLGASKAIVATIESRDRKPT
jgi:class 3 adenylate cyclase